MRHTSCNLGLCRKAEAGTAEAQLVKRSCRPGSPYLKNSKVSLGATSKLSTIESDTRAPAGRTHVCPLTTVSTSPAFSRSTSKEYNVHNSLSWVDETSKTHFTWSVCHLRSKIRCSPRLGAHL